MLMLFGLLSRLKLSKKPISLEVTARMQHYFPIVGAAIGLIVAFVAYLLFYFIGGSISPLLIAAMVVLLLYFLTGIIHLEGLADFGDGLMTSGDIARKRSAMKDVSLGAAGTFFLAFDLLLMVFLIGELSSSTISLGIFQWDPSIFFVGGIIVAEISGKLAMTTVMTLGPSSHEGMGSIFVKAASRSKYAVALILSLLLAFASSGWLFPIVLCGVIAGLVVTFIARKHFGGVSGDSFGAANELGRILALFIWVIVI